MNAPVDYEIRVRGHLDSERSAWFEGLHIAPEGDGVTVLSGPLRDQAALHGVLTRIRDLGLTLLSVRLPFAPKATTILQSQLADKRFTIHPDFIELMESRWGSTGMCRWSSRRCTAMPSCAL